MLEQVKDHRHLQEIGTLMMKKKDIQSFPKLEHFERMIINEKYVAVGSKLFYLRAETPYDNGILDFEELSNTLIKDKK